jgi:uncharacterized protein YcaQ
MARRKPVEPASPRPKLPPATSPEARETRLISMAYDLAEERLLNGTATSQEIVHFLRLGSIREKKELEMMEKKNELMSAKTEALQSAKRVEELYSDAIKAFAAYRGVEETIEDDENIY